MEGVQTAQLMLDPIVTISLKHFKQLETHEQNVGVWKRRAEAAERQPTFNQEVAKATEAFIGSISKDLSRYGLKAARKADGNWTVIKKRGGKKK